MQLIKLEESLKEKITQDWQRSFPDMGIYQPMKLLRRYGPILMGLQLYETTENDHYIPLMYIHNLCKPVPEIKLEIYLPLVNKFGGVDAIPAAVHDVRYKDAALRLKLQSTSVFRIFDFDELNNIYFRQIKVEQSRETPVYETNFYENILLLYAWAKKGESRIKILLDDFRKKMATWPKSTHSVFGEEGLQGWYSKMSILTQNRDFVLKTIESEIISHKLESIPSQDLKL